MTKTESPIENGFANLIQDALVAWVERVRIGLIMQRGKKITKKKLLIID